MHERVAFYFSHPINFWTLGMVIIFLDQASVELSLVRYLFPTIFVNVHVEFSTRGELQ